MKEIKEIKISTNCLFPKSRLCTIKNEIFTFAQIIKNQPIEQQPVRAIGKYKSNLKKCENNPHISSCTRSKKGESCNTSRLRGV